MIEVVYILYSIGVILCVVTILLLYVVFGSEEIITRNIHHWVFYDKSTKKIMYHQSNPFYRRFNDLYMSNTVKTELITTVQDFNKHSNSFKEKNVPRSLRLILSGKEGIGKTTLTETIASEFEYGIIHFPKNNYSEKMIHSFFKSINLTTHNIITFDNIDFNSIIYYNRQLYDLLAELIIKNDKNNIFIFTFSDLNTIPSTFTSNFHIHHHYHMDTHINYIMKMISDQLNKTNANENNEKKLKEIKENLLQLNHKITPGYIIPYLAFNEDFQKSLDRFFAIIKH